MIFYSKVEKELRTHYPRIFMAPCHIEYFKMEFEKWQVPEGLSGLLLPLKQILRPPVSAAHPISAEKEYVYL